MSYVKLDPTMADGKYDFVAERLVDPWSPDLNPLDYLMWAYVEAQACKRSHPSVKTLKSVKTRKWQSTLGITFQRRILASSIVLRMSLINMEDTSSKFV